VARTGTEELACWDLAGRGDILSSWLAFVAGIEQRGVRPFDGCEVEDASEALVPLFLWGPQASNVLSDYLGEQTVPGKGTVTNRTLDRIGCLVATPDFGETPCHLVLVPPLYARVLWRSFLSFQSVSPVGMRALVREVASRYPFLAPAEGEDRLTATRQELAYHGLLRSEPTFIGARGLS
jgi:aminomethyltransferase